MERLFKKKKQEKPEELGEGFVVVDSPPPKGSSAPSTPSYTPVSPLSEQRHHAGSYPSLSMPPPDVEMKPASPMKGVFDWDTGRSEEYPQLSRSHLMLDVGERADVSLPPELQTQPMDAGMRYSYDATAEHAAISRLRLLEKEREAACAALARADEQRTKLMQAREARKALKEEKRVQAAREAEVEQQRVLLEEAGKRKEQVDRVKAAAEAAQRLALMRQRQTEARGVSAQSTREEDVRQQMLQRQLKAGGGGSSEEEKRRHSGMMRRDELCAKFLQSGVDTAVVTHVFDFFAIMDERTMQHYTMNRQETFRKFLNRGFYPDLVNHALDLYPVSQPDKIEKFLQENNARWVRLVREGYASELVCATFSRFGKMEDAKLHEFMKPRNKVFKTLKLEMYPLSLVLFVLFSDLGGPDSDVDAVREHVRQRMDVFRDLLCAGFPAGLANHALTVYPMAKLDIVLGYVRQMNDVYRRLRNEGFSMDIVGAALDFVDPSDFEEMTKVCKNATTIMEVLPEVSAERIISSLQSNPDNVEGALNQLMSAQNAK